MTETTTTAEPWLRRARRRCVAVMRWSRLRDLVALLLGVGLGAGIAIAATAVSDGSAAARGISVIKDVAIIAGTTTGALVAWRGLATWRKQLQGTARFDACRKFLEATLRLREEILTCRSPGIMGSEVGRALAARGIQNWDPRQAPLEEVEKHVLYARIDRMNKVIDALVLCQSEAIALEVLLGPPARDAIMELRSVVLRMRSAIDNRMDGVSDEADRAVLNATTGEASKAFGKRVDDAIGIVERLTGPHLRERLA